MTESVGAPLEGRLDEATHHNVRGWARDPTRPEEKLALQIRVDGRAAGRVVADLYRADLAAGSIGDCAFEMALPALSRARPHEIRVVRAEDGAELPGSPLILDPKAGGIDTALRAGLERAVGEVAAADLDPAIEFLLRQAGRLITRRARLCGLPATGPKHALYIDLVVPRPSEDAGSQAALGHMRALQGLGFQVGFAATEMPDSDDPAVGDLRRLGIRCLARPDCRSVEEALIAGPLYDLVYLHRLATARDHLAAVRRHCPAARLVYGVGDLHHWRLARQAALLDDPEIAAEARRLRQAELAAARSADAVVTHSTAEAAWLVENLPGKPVHVVPWPVAARPCRAPLAARQGLAFVGGYRHAPNVDAALWLVREVMPLVWRDCPHIPCLLVGSHMPPELRRLAGPLVEALGAVPDLGDIFERVRLTVAPLRWGAGIKGKVLDSLAAGLPCAMTGIAAEGLDLPPALADCIAPDAASLAAAICRLHESEADNRRCAEAGLDYVRLRLSPTHIATLLAEATGRV